MYLTEGFYWDLNDETRAWSKRFFGVQKKMPTMVQAGQYSSVYHYLKAVKAAGTDDTKKVMAQMKKTPINDFFAKNGQIREDGRMVHDMYLMQVKKPAESKYPWDYYHVRQVIPAAEAFQPLAQSAARWSRSKPLQPRSPERPCAAPAWSDPWKYSASHPPCWAASCWSG
jgi:branched-chain amino acid transport system substrate-binding protein